MSKRRHQRNDSKDPKSRRSLERRIAKILRRYPGCTASEILGHLRCNTNPIPDIGSLCMVLRENEPARFRSEGSSSFSRWFLRDGLTNDTLQLHQEPCGPSQWPGTSALQAEPAINSRSILDNRKSNASSFPAKEGTSGKPAQQARHLAQPAIRPARSSPSASLNGSHIPGTPVRLFKMDATRYSDLMTPDKWVYRVRQCGIRLWEWQRRALMEWHRRGAKGVVEAVTGTGKTVVGLGAAAACAQDGYKTVVLVHTKDLQQQWHKEFQQWLPRLSIGLFDGDHKDSLDEHPVLIALVQSAWRYHLLPHGAKGLLIADECHHYGAEKWSKALGDRFELRLGLTATFERDDGGLEKYLQRYFTETSYSLDYGEALADDIIAHFKVAFIRVELNQSERSVYDRLSEDIRRARSKLESAGLQTEPFGEFLRAVKQLAEGKYPSSGDYQLVTAARCYLRAFQDRCALLAGCESKRERIASLMTAINRAERTIVFTQTKEVAKQATRILTSHGISTEALDSDADPEERSARIAGFNDGDIAVLAAPRLLDEGVDVREADLAIVVAASRSRRQMIQRMGRILRKKKDGRLARFAVLCVSGTREDPKVDGHEGFLGMIEDHADDCRTFGPRADASAICDYLNDWSPRTSPGDLSPA